MTRYKPVVLAMTLLALLTQARDTEAGRLGILGRLFCRTRPSCAPVRCQPACPSCAPVHCQPACPPCKQPSYLIVDDRVCMVDRIFQIYLNEICLLTRYDALMCPETNEPVTWDTTLCELGLEGCDDQGSCEPLDSISYSHLNRKEKIKKKSRLPAGQRATEIRFRGQGDWRADPPVQLSFVIPGETDPRYAHARWAWKTTDPVATGNGFGGEANHLGGAQEVTNVQVDANNKYIVRVTHNARRYTIYLETKAP